MMGDDEMIDRLTYLARGDSRRWLAYLGDPNYNCRSNNNRTVILLWPVSLGDGLTDGGAAWSGSA